MQNYLGIIKLAQFDIAYLTLMPSSVLAAPGEEEY